MSGFRKGTDIFLTRQIKKVCSAPSRWKTDLCSYVFVSRVSFYTRWLMSSSRLPASMSITGISTMV